MPDSVIPPETIRAYMVTDYCVDGEAPFVMRIGEPCDELASVYAASGFSSCAFITACNWLGAPADDTLNEARQAAFARMLASRGLAWLCGAGRDPRGEYPPEPSYLVLGVGLEESKAIGRELHQNAIVFCEADSIPHLLLLR